MKQAQGITEQLFQSTPSAWRETSGGVDCLGGRGHFNPLPPHGGRLITMPIDFKKFNISIHSLRMEGDLLIEFRGQWRRISIHSLRMEGDPEE